jgi:SnoaL-like domain
MSADKTKKTAQTLVKYCRENQTEKGLKELYDAAAVSVEAMPMQGSESAETKGRDAIKGKHDWWYANFEVNRQVVDGPYMHGDDRFGVIFEFEATNKQSGEKMQMRELGIYTTNGKGKIVREEFYYSA